MGVSDPALDRPGPRRAGIAVKVGTLGAGVDVTASIVPKLNARGNFNFFKYSFSGTQSDVRYDTDLKLRSFAVLLDLHPIPRRGLRLSGGLLFNKNELGMVSQPTVSYTIGSKTYSNVQVGTLDGRVDFNRVAPYLGIGWGNATGRRVGIAFDLGVAFQGSPKVSLTATGPIATDPAFKNELNQEVQSVKDDLKAFKYYPVFSLGVSFKL